MKNKISHRGSCYWAIVFVIVACQIGQTWQQIMTQTPLPMQTPNSQALPQQQQQQLGIGSGGSGVLQQTIYEFLRTNSQTTKFMSALNQVVQQTNDNILIPALSGQSVPGMLNPSGLTVFVPVDNAFMQAPSDPAVLKNDLSNFISKEAITLDQIDGKVIRNTFGFQPKWMLKAVKNVYSWYSPSAQTGVRKISEKSARAKRQAYNQQSQMNNPMLNNPQMQMNPSMGPASQQMNSQLNPQLNPQMGSQLGNMNQMQQPGMSSFQQQQQSLQQQQQQPFGASSMNQPMQSSFSQGLGQQLNQGSVMTGTQQVTDPALLMLMQAQANNGLSIYDTFNQFYGGQIPKDLYIDLNISPKLPLDTIFLVNGAIVIDYYQLSNGYVYLLSSYPRYYDKSFFSLASQNDVSGLAQNINFWIQRALVDESLKDALSVYGPNTYFIPVDQAINAFGSSSLMNNKYLIDILFRAHRVSNLALFDYYLTDQTTTYYTDTGLPVDTTFSRVNGQDQIEISIGHVKGRILPQFRNIYCASGVIHLVDTVLGIPIRNAYQEISIRPDLSIFRSLLDRSSFRTALDQPVPTLNIQSTSGGQYPYGTQTRMARQQNQTFNERVARQIQQTQQPQQQIMQQQQQLQQQLTPLQQQQAMQLQQLLQKMGYNQYGYAGQSIVTVLAPSDTALALLKDFALGQNQTVIDAIIANHIISSSQSAPYYSMHDNNVFTNGQMYSTMNPNFGLTAAFNPDSRGYPRLTFSNSQNPSVRARVVNANNRVSNGAIHVINRVLTDVLPTDVSSLLNMYPSSSWPAFNQFIDVLKSTGVFNDLQQQSKQFTLFIPTNDALIQYQNIINGNDFDLKRNFVYRHLCIDQNLQSTILNSGLNPQPYNPGMNNNPTNMMNPNMNQNNPNMFNPSFNQQNQLVCTNGLGQQVTLTSDPSLLVMNPDSAAKVLQDFPGQFSSAYILENTLLNPNLPNDGLNNYNSSVRSAHLSTLLLTILLMLVSLLTF